MYDIQWSVGSDIPNGRQLTFDILMYVYGLAQKNQAELVVLRRILTENNIEIDPTAYMLEVKYEERNVLEAEAAAPGNWGAFARMLLERLEAEGL